MEGGMTQHDPAARLVEEFSDPQTSALPWSQVVAELESAQMYWLSTVRRDGRPHVAPLPAMWLDGRLHFCTGAHEQKARNLEANANCALTTGTSTFRAGVDVVVEGAALPVTDNGTLARLAPMWKEKLEWVFKLGDGVFIDAESGSPAIVFAVTPAKVLAFTKNPYSQTRYQWS
jgi:general stress protein 26